MCESPMRAGPDCVKLSNRPKDGPACGQPTAISRLITATLMHKIFVLQRKSFGK